ncbi:hypothetical protein [Sanguibacter suaedae]|uniref:Uncharacterized protein n=1 Tax=Sanguibacter suaedae TaxID=2795737 RepID=A0A934ME70_9MICO|nr:hypothetical protein [Sanguibacter suaedae]MBI9115424.1 hypothetical protein [Sanguibacter suaedae]
MNHSWADGGYENQGPGPSRAARTAVTVLVVLATATAAAAYAKMGLDQMETRCYTEAPAGTTAADVTATFRWLPPGYDCSYS